MLRIITALNGKLRKPWKSGLWVTLKRGTSWIWKSIIQYAFSSLADSVKKKRRRQINDQWEEQVRDTTWRKSGRHRHWYKWIICWRTEKDGEGFVVRSIWWTCELMIKPSSKISHWHSSLTWKGLRMYKPNKIYRRIPKILQCSFSF